MMKEQESIQQKAIVFYDGSCGFCQASVQFVLKHNRQQNLYFTALQSGLASELMVEAQLAEPLPDSMLFYEGGSLYTESDAALRIARHLRFPLFLLSYGRIIPSFVRNFLYRIIARNRYFIAGRTVTCLLPTPQQRKRFLF